MLLKRKGFPEEGELVLATVTKIFHHSVFTNLDEYDKSGLIHISEISPGRIRNLRDYVSEGKKIVCVVLRTDQEKGHIDLSLRRVNERQRIGKNNLIKQEQKSEKILELICQKQKLDFKKTYAEVFAKVSEKYSTLTEAFEEVVAGTLELVSLGIEKKLAAELTESVKLRMKPPIVEMKGQFSITSYQSDGIELIKEAFESVSKVKNLSIKYGGAGKYNVVLTSETFKDAEKELASIVEKVTAPLEKAEAHVEFRRIDAKTVE